MSFTGGITPPATVRGVSEKILNKLSWEKGQIYGRDGYSYFNDFLTGSAGLTTYAGTGCTVTGSTDLAGGGVRMYFDGTANDEVSWGPGDATTAPYIINTTGTGKVAFEIRIMKSIVTNNSLAFVAGLGKRGLVADNLLADSTGALADVDFVGFQVLQAAGATVNFVWRKTGQTLQTGISGVATLTASGYARLGFVYDPQETASKRIRVFVDGVENATGITSTQVAAATFPSAVALNPVVGGIVGSGAAAVLSDTDWLFAHQSA